MAYNPNLPAGTYRARALQADCFPTNNNEGLMLGVEWVIAQGEYEGCQISGNICLIDGSGNLTKNYANTREWAKSWDGIDTAYFKGHFSEWDVEIVVERKMIDVRDEDGNLSQREVPEIKWVNDPNGRHSKAVKAGDHRALGAKFGAKLRAAAAANPAPAPANGQQMTSKKTAAPSQPSQPSSLMREAWDKFKEKNADLGDEELKSKWFTLVKAHYDGDNLRQAPDEVWTAVISDIDDDMPF